MTCTEASQKFIASPEVRRKLKVTPFQYHAIKENDHDDTSTTFVNCCCSPELPHDINLKLKLFHHQNCRDFGNFSPFLKLQKGNLNFTNKLPFKEPIFRGIISLGMEKILHNIYEAFVIDRKRILLLVGVSGSGRSSVCKQVSNVMMQHNKARAVKYVNMTGISNLDVLVSRMLWVNRMSSVKANLAELEQDDDTLVVLENINAILEANSLSFFSFMKQLHEKTRFRVLVMGEFDESFIGRTSSNMKAMVEEVFFMPSVSKQKAVRLLQLLTNGRINRAGASQGQDFEVSVSEDELLAHPLLEIKSQGQKITPNYLEDIAYFINHGLALDDIEERLEAESTGMHINTSGEDRQDKIDLM